MLALSTCPSDMDEQVQRAKDYYKPYFAVTQPMHLKPLEVTVHELLPEKQWMSRKENQN
jgi:hypothetical protein